MKGWLKITLKSELCAGSGESEAGLVDMKIALEDGIPVIPARRIKGALLTEGKEMASNGWIDEYFLEKLFGVQGEEKPGALRIGNAHLQKIPKGSLGVGAPDKDILIADYEKTARELRGVPDFQESLAEQFLTVERTRTALDTDAGVAHKTSLRTMQFIPRGLVFCSEIEVESQTGQDALKALEWCVKALRHLGTGITRGLGEVSCSLEWEKHPDKKAAVKTERPFDPEDFMEMDYEIELKTPVLFPGENGLYEDCGEQIPGAAVLGALAGMYIQDYGLGNTAHEDPDFQRIFLKDGVKFGYGFLKKGDRIFYPCPAHLSGVKGKTGKVANRFADVEGNLRRTTIKGQICLENEILFTTSVEKELRMHHARPQDRGIGHALHDRVPNTGADMGQLFQYVSLSKGQKFSGTLQGKAGDLKKLADCLERRENRISLGRSRSAEYGQAEMKIFAKGGRKLDESREETADEKTFLIWLVTPMVLMDENASIHPDPEIFRKMLKEEGVEALEDSIVTCTKTAGYNSRWRLPVPQYEALDQGSVLAVKTARSPLELEKIRWGEMTGKGYGQIKTLPAEVQIERMAQAPEIQEIQTAGESDFVKAFLKWREERQEKLERKQEAGDAIEETKKIPNSGRIEQLIRLAEEGKDREQILYAMEGMKGTERESVYEEIEQFLEPCREKDRLFLRFYLEEAKFKGRKQRQ